VKLFLKEFHSKMQRLSVQYRVNTLFHTPVKSVLRQQQGEARIEIKKGDELVGTIGEDKFGQ
jgi:hypothetical protein